MTRHLYDRLRAEVAELRRRLSVVSVGGGGGGSHAASHEDGGADELDVTGLSGVLADPQTPAAHAATHSDGGGDDVSVLDLAGYPGGGTTFLRDDGTFAAPSGGVSDSDKGDITVSSSGTVWTIDNDVVTNAKAANMAEATIKGRADGAGTGDPTDLTANQVSTILDGATDPFLRTSAAGGVGSPVGPELEATIGATFTGSDIAVGKQRTIRVPHGFVPLTWVVYTDATISIVIDIWADNLGAYPPANADTIVPGGTEPAISGALIDDGDASPFDPIAAGDFVTFNIDSVTVGSATWVTVQLIGTRT